MVMGIPTVKRKVKSYLSETLRSLIDKLSPEEKLDCVIIVFVGEVRCCIHWVITFCKVNLRMLRKGLCVSCVGTVWSLQTDVDYVHSVVAGIEKEWVHVLIEILWRNENNWDSACVALVNVTNDLLLVRFSTELGSGLLEVISPPAAYYPDLTSLKETFGDSRERVK